MQTFTLASLNIGRGGFEKEVWILVLEKISRQHSEAIHKARGEILEMVNKVAPENPLLKKIIRDQEKNQKEEGGPYSNYVNAKLSPLLKGDVRNTPIEVLQNDLVQHYEYPVRKEEKLKECIRDLSFMTLDGLLSSYYWQKN
ncbi:MAG TPA: hypothetical protein VE912_24130 [Bacteroidales bacterium]|nr:hypothetical protein [Bacteroidales bacterium]